MQKTKNYIFLALTMLLVIMGALLPGIAAAIQDAAAQEAGFDSMQSVELKFRDDTHALEALWLYRDSTASTISPSDASLTEQQVLDIAADTIGAYVDAGLIAYEIDLRQAKLTATLGYDSQEPEENGIFWYLTLTGDADLYDSMNITIDDATGRVIHIYYFSNSAVYASDDKPMLLDIISSLYFEQIGAPSLFQEPEAYGISYWSREDRPSKNSSEQSVLYTLIHPEYGTLGLAFIIYDAGFFIDIY